MPFTMAAAQGHIGIMKMLLEDKYKSLDLPHDWMVTYVDNKGDVISTYSIFRLICILIHNNAYLFLC